MNQKILSIGKKQEQSYFSKVLSKILKEITFSKNGIELILEEFGSPYKKEEIEKKIEGVEQKYKNLEEQSQQNASVQEKYSLDYDKKFNNIKDEEDKKKELDDIMKGNPYLQAMGCSHDRRKYFVFIIPIQIHQIIISLTRIFILIKHMKKERELFEKPTKEKLDNSEYFKNEGNKAIKEKDYEKAAYFYQKLEFMDIKY